MNNFNHKIINNYIFVIPDKHFESILDDDGNEILCLDNRFLGEKHFPSSGKVVAVPDHLFYEPDFYSPDALRYLTTMELQPGDKVIFHYLAVQNAANTNIFFDHPDGRAYGVKYDYCYLRIRQSSIFNLQSSIHPLNGFLIVHPQFDIINHSARLHLPQHIAKKKDMQRGVIVYAGSPILKYRDFPELSPDNGSFPSVLTDEVSPGDMVVYPKWDNVPIQQGMHQIINRGMPLIRMQRRDLVCKIIQNIAA